MSVKNIVIDLETAGQKITGTFRGLLTLGKDDILILGNKKSSVLILFTDVNIKSIKFTHTDNKISKFGNGTANKTISRNYTVDGATIITEKYIPPSKQTAFMLLTCISTKYKNDKNIIDTEEFYTEDTGLQYCITGCDTFKFGPKQSEDCDIQANNYIPTYKNLGNRTNVQPKVEKKEKPKITKDETMTIFMNKVLDGYSYKRNCHGDKCSIEKTV